MRSRIGLAAVLVASAVAVTSSPAGATDYVNDPLTSATFAGRGSKGGSFGPTGWTTIDEPDSFWYEIADALPSGSIEYTVTGMSVGGSLSGYDHDILTMYQAPTGAAEPIAYSPYFRNNDFKAFTRIFGSLEPGRGGAMKLELALCSRGDPWYHDEVCTTACDGSGLAYARGTDKDIGWDPAHSYRMVLTWGSGKFTFSRDGEELGVVTYPDTYAPQPLRVRFGSPRHDGVYPGAAFMPKGLTFKDVKVSGTPGSRTPICGSTAVDAGTTDTGVVPDASTSTTELTALQDVTGASWEPAVFSDVNDLNVEASASVPTAIVYLKFPPISPPPKRVVLKLRTGTSSSAAGGSGEPCLVSDDGWSETTLTWASKPPTGACAGGARSIDSDVDVEWDVTSLLVAPSSANRNLAIVSKDSNGAHYLSKEASAAKGPRLLVVPGDPGADAGATDSGPKTDAGSDASSADAGVDARTGDAKPSDDLDHGDVNGGCGCRTTDRPASTSSVGALALAIGLALSRRLRIARRD
jgi:MYXO-CTERM domain-containing protein